MNRDSSKRRPRALKLLIATEGLFALLGFASAFGLLSSPSGEGMGLPPDLLDNTPLGDFTLVGLFFVAFYGVLPTLATYGLLTRKRWRWTDVINRWTGQHWGWTASAAVGVILLLWIAVEIVLLGVLSEIGGVLQAAMAALGVWMLLLAFLPSVRSSTKLED
ncbi:MAG: hypothetical protein JSV94_00140 [Methanobacteriota archaeon]|nr:MAG: hypothetical protein JSV94_00140 [Euryarchaeota archaeon]